MRKTLLTLFMVAVGWMAWAQKPNIAPNATVTADGSGGGGCRTGACSTLNDLDFGTCGTQQMWISTTPPNPVGVDYIEWNWSIPQAFDEMTIHHGSNTARSLTGFLMQWWDGSQWVNGESWSNLPQQCVNTVTFQRIVTSRMRITSFEMTAPGQQSNPNFREIEIFQASTSNDDAGVVATNTTPAVCPGTYPVIVQVQNFGLNRIDSVDIAWTMDGVAQPTVTYSTQLDTIGGSGPSNAMVNLGNYTFAPGQTYTLKAWTTMPNSAADTSNFNDTLEVTVALGAPTGLAAGNLTSTSARINWDTIAGTDYGIIYGPTGFDPNTAGTTVLPASMPYTINGLAPTMDYDVYLFADCGGSTYSDTAAPITFSTLISGPQGVNCGASNSTFVLVEDFETQGIWTGDISSSTGDWNYNSGSTGSSNTGPTGAYSGDDYIYFEASASGPASLISPAIDLSAATDSAELAFWMHAYGNDVGYLVIRVSTSSATGPFNDTIFNYTQGSLQSSSSDPWQHVGVRLDQYVGQTIWLEFEADRANNSFSGDIALDFLTVEACGTFCLPQIYKVDSVIAATTTAMAYVDTFAGNYQIEWGPCGFAQGTGTFVSGSNGVNITGLSPNTCYDMYVRRDCGANGNSLWGGPFSFRTTCAAYTAPYFDNFDGVTAPAIPYCWATIGSAIQTVTSTDHGASIPSAPNALEMNDGSPDILVSPEFSDLGSGLNRARVKIAYEGAGQHQDTLFVGVMPNQVDPGKFVYYDTLVLSNTTTDFHEYHIDFDNTSLVDTNTYIAFKYGNAGGNWEFYFDDFNYEVIPACSEPQFLGAMTTSTDSVRIYWTTGGATGWEVQYGVEGFTPGNGTSMYSTNDTTDITGLIAATKYEFYVRDTCGGNGVSAWAGPFPFTTAVCEESQKCVYTLDLYDDYGDGWNGAEVSLVQSGITVATVGSSFTTGDSINDVEVSLCDGITTYLILSDGGSFPSEVAVKVTSPYPNVLANYPATSGAGTGDTLAVFTSSCALPSCPQPVNVGAVSVIDTSAVLKWDSVSAAGSYQVWFGPQGFYQGTQTTGGTKFIVSADSVLMDTLTDNQCYEFLVRGICGPGDSSRWTGPRNFCTECRPYAMPYYESFNTWPLSCWDVNQGGQPWVQYNGSGGDNYAEASFWTYNSVSMVMNSPAVMITQDAQVRFDWSHQYNASYPGDELIVRASVLGSGVWDTLVQLSGSDLDDPTASSTAPGNFITETALLDPSTYNGQLVTIQFWGNSDWGPDLFINDVYIEKVPTCFRVQDVAAGSLVDTSATITWNDTSSVSSSYEVWIGQQGFYNGPASVGGQKGIVNSPSMVIDTLSPESCYDVLVRSICGPGDSSNWEGPVSFCTPCSPVAAPYFEDFDNLTTGMAGNFGNCWIGTGTTSDYSWRSNSGTTGSSSTGPSGDATSGSGVYMYTEASYGSAGDSTMLTSPLIDISALTAPELSFAYHMYGSLIDTLYIDVYDGTNWTMGVSQLNAQQQSASSDPWSMSVVNLAPYVSGNILQVRFRLESQGCCAGDAAIDDVTIGNPITCFRPDSVMAVNITTTSADISWVTGGASNWNIEYGPTGFVQGQGTMVNTTNNPYNLTGLSPATAYDVYVRDSCGAGDVSQWFGPLTFYTLCPQFENLPFSENFEGVSLGSGTSFENCWSTSGTSGLHWEAEDSEGQNENSSSTGPFYDATYPATDGGTYMYLETSSTGDSSELYSPYIYIGGASQPELEYYYHMYGATMNKLEVYAEERTTGARSFLDSIVGQQQTAGSDSFIAKTVSMASVAYDTVRLVFVGYRGSSYTGDISIDEVSVTDANSVVCNEPTALAVGATGCDTLVVSWTSNTGSSVIEYGPTGFTPGQGTMTGIVTSPYTITGLTPGTSYDIMVADTCSGDTSSFTAPVSGTTDVAPLPVAVITQGVDSISNGSQYFALDAAASTDAVSYSWDFGNGATGTGMNVNPAYSTAGVYTVVLTATNACGTDTDTLEITADISLDESALSRSISMYPNPAKDEVNLSFEASASTSAVIRVMEISGKEVMEIREENINGHFQSKLDISSLADGVYMVEITSGNMKAIRRLIKD